MKAKRGELTCFNIFFHTLILSAFTIGGGYVMVPLMRERFVERLGWIDEAELAELIALGQSAPGAMVINSATLMGYRLKGLPGALCAILGTALPPILILSLVCMFYELIRDNAYVSAAFRGMRAGVAAVIADTVVSMASPYVHRDKAPYIAIMLAAFIAAYAFSVNVAFVIISCGALGVLLGFMERRRAKG